MENKRYTIIRGARASDVGGKKKSRLNGPRFPGNAILINCNTVLKKRKYVILKWLLM